MPHTFDSCPLRSSSSLIIVEQNDQTIVTATEKVFDMFGYRPSDLIGKPMAVLGVDRQKCTARHARGGRVSLEICIHHNPLQSTASPLDYWLIRLAPVQHFPLKTATPMLINPFGVIDRMDSSRWMVGRPIMSFLHHDDVPTLCGHLDRLYRDPSSHVTLYARWSSQPNEHQWITITGHFDDPQPTFRSRITCVLRPVKNPKALETLNRQERPWTTYTIWLEGKAYVSEFASHVMGNVADMLLPAANEKRQSVFARVFDGDVIRLVPLLGQIDNVEWHQRWQTFARNAIAAHPIAQASVAVLYKTIPTQLFSSLEAWLEWIAASLSAILRP